MSCNFDSSDIKAGAAYTQIVSNITYGTEGIKACFDQYEKWLNDDACKPENILLRAFIYNNDGLAKQLADATAFDSRALPWDALIGGYKKAVEVLNSNEATAASALMARMMGPMAKAGGHFLDGAAKLVITILGMHSGLGWQRHTFQGSRKEFRAFLVRQILETSDAPLNQAQIKVAVARELKLAAIHGERLEGRGTLKWVAMRQQGTTTLRTPSSLSEIRFQKFGQLISSDVRRGVCVGILQFICLTKTIADHAKALEGDMAEATSRLAAGIIGVTGTICETIGATVTRMGRLGFRWARGIAAIKWTAGLELSGKILGLGGAAIMALWDFIKVYDEAKKGNSFTAALYGASGLAGLAVAVFLMSGFGPLAFAAIIIYLCIVFVLEMTKDNAVQSWIENCVFGIQNSYSTAELEMRELSNALK